MTHIMIYLKDLFLNKSDIKYFAFQLDHLLSSNLLRHIETSHTLHIYYFTIQDIVLFKIQCPFQSSLLQLRLCRSQPPVAV